MPLTVDLHLCNIRMHAHIRTYIKACSFCYPFTQCRRSHCCLSNVPLFDITHQLAQYSGARGCGDSQLRICQSRQVQETNNTGPQWMSCQQHSLASQTIPLIARALGHTQMGQSSQPDYWQHEAPLKGLQHYQQNNTILANFWLFEHSHSQIFYHETLCVASSTIPLPSFIQFC